MTLRPWTPRRKSVVFSGLVLAVAATLLISALVGANGLLSPVRDGRDWWQERSLTHHTRSMSVLVGAIDGDDAAPLAGAQVYVERVPNFRDTADIGAGHDADELHQATTGAGGRAVFELATGGPYWLPLYRVTVVHEGRSAERDVMLTEDLRVRLYFDAGGDAYWRWIAHRDLEEGRGGASLAVDVLDWRHCELDSHGWPSVCPDDGPLPTVAIYHVRDGDRAERVEGREVPGRRLVFDLEMGVYDVVVTYEGQTVAERLLLACDWERLHHYDGASLRLESEETCGGWTSLPVTP